MRVGRYLHTLRYLRPIQVYGRALQRFYHPKPDFRPPPTVRRRERSWTRGARRSPAMIGPRRFRFLNQEHELQWPQGWSDSTRSRLWLYNLHYFDDLVADDFSNRALWHQQLIEQWIADHVPDRGGPGWEPYPTSLRITNWIKWALAGGSLPDRSFQVLAAQARYLRQRIETHLLGNHVLANAKALIFAGCFFTGDEPLRWLRQGFDLLDKQLAEQILADGGHYELSPMYHSVILEDLLDLVNLLQVYPDAAARHGDDALKKLRRKIVQMQIWLAAMTFPDGRIALFNDAAWGIVPPPSELSSYAERLGLPAMPAPADGITSLSSSGYTRLQLGPAVVIVDVGEIGPSFLPGHGHADVLTFEMAIFDQRVIVNSGTSVYYGDEAERHRQRGTAAHNTVEVDQQDSSEVWDYFRVARRAHPRDLVIEEQADGSLLVACSHDGYRRLSGRVMHRRRWRLWPDRLNVHDELSGYWQIASARFHLDPMIIPTSTTDHRIELGFGSHQLLTVADQAAVSVKPSTYHPEFGVAVPNQCIIARMSGSQASHQFGWC